jgi:hypothetical protein
VAAALAVSGGRRPRPLRRVVTRMLARRTKSRLHVKRNDSRMIGVRHDGMNLFDSYPVLESTISLVGLGWWMIYIYIM